MELLSTFYDKKYYEDGIASGKSCYVNYRWIPELTIPMAYFMIRELGINPGDRVLDYGCSKGYLTRALRLLGVDAYGVDVSEYAVRQADAEVRDHVAQITKNNPVPWDLKFDWIITKDVLEHVPDSGLDEFFKNFSPLTKKMFHILPLGDNGVFRIPEYHLDRSHIQINNEHWWSDLFAQHGWNTTSIKHRVPGIKDNWAEKHSTGDGFFTLER
jgi:SAM-dependent methyltransferase